MCNSIKYNYCNLSIIIFLLIRGIHCHVLTMNSKIKESADEKVLGVTKQRKNTLNKSPVVKGIEIVI